MDLLQKLISGEGRKVELPGPETEDTGALELNLGLSLGGRFSGDKNKLARASSVIDLSVAQPDDSLPFIGNKLNRWSSLPAKTPWLEFPEFGFCPPGRQDCRGSTQCEKTEAKRQKLAGGFEGARISVQRENGEGIGEGTARFPLDLPCRVRAFPSGETTTLREDLGFLGNFPETSQRSSTSGVSDPETQTSQGFKMHMEIKCPDKQHPVRGCSVRADAVPSKMMMGDLPYVCTRVGGQNGKKIEGFLYKYDKGEEIRIVCACHGNFLSPAEFVKHGGGGDVEHPLRHIVVNPFPPFLRQLRRSSISRQTSTQFDPICLDNLYALEEWVEEEEDDVILTEEDAEWINLQGAAVADEEDVVGHVGDEGDGAGGDDHDVDEEEEDYYEGDDYLVDPPNDF